MGLVTSIFVGVTDALPLKLGVTSCRHR